MTNKETPHPCKCLTIKDLASLFGCGDRTIRRMYISGRLPAPFRLPGGTVWKWRERDIIKFIDDLSGEETSE